MHAMEIDTKGNWLRIAPKPTGSSSRLLPFDGAQVLPGGKGQS